LSASRSCQFGKGGIFVLDISAIIQGDAPTATILQKHDALPPLSMPLLGKSKWS
jgi:hypothetical protein